MRPSLLTLCLLPALLIGCSTVQVSPVRQLEQTPMPGVVASARGDRADTTAFPPADVDGYRPPERLAVLLPMSGALAAPAAGVRDGFLAAYYAETRRRPLVKFYDSLGTGQGAQAALSRALADGAQMIVGPLTREEVNAISGNPGVPMIALNRGSQPVATGGTSFALLPDQEGAALANRLLSRGLSNALVFSNRSDTAQRAIAAMRETLARNGGSVVSEIAVVGQVADLTPQLAGLQASPTPPQVVVLAIEAGPARAMAEQLRSSALAGLPRYATSLVLNGANARADAELDGIEYPELPWLLQQSQGLPEASGLARSLPSARGPSQRLFAFGADAWKLAAYFERLYNDPDFSVRGATGVLRIDVSGPVQRVPTWAVFSGGRGRASHDSGGDVSPNR